MIHIYYPLLPLVITEIGFGKRNVIIHTQFLALQAGGYKVRAGCMSYDMGNKKANNGILTRRSSLPQRNCATLPNCLKSSYTEDYQKLDHNLVTVYIVFTYTLHIKLSLCFTS